MATASHHVVHAVLAILLIAAEACSATSLLIVGGNNIWDFRLGAHPSFASGGNNTERYNTATKKWTAGPKLRVVRGGSLALKLPNGSVLIAGGRTPVSFDFATQDPTDPVKSAEVYTNGNWKLTGALKDARSNHGAAVIAARGFTAMVAGGDQGRKAAESKMARTVERYNVRTGKWSFGAPMPVPRSHFSLIPMGSRVFAVGGFTRRVDIYTPSTNKWSAGPALRQARSDYSWVRMAKGGILVSGGAADNSRSEVYNPRTNKWAITGKHVIPRRHTALTLLPGGRVFAVGGLTSPDSNTPTATTEIWDPNTNAWRRGPNLRRPRAGAIIKHLGKDSYLVAGGYKRNKFGDNFETILRSELFSLKTNRFSDAGDLKVGHFAPDVALITL